MLELVTVIDIRGRTQRNSVSLSLIRKDVCVNKLGSQGQRQRLHRHVVINKEDAQGQSCTYRRHRRTWPRAGCTWSPRSISTSSPRLPNRTGRGIPGRRSCSEGRGCRCARPETRGRFGAASPRNGTASYPLGRVVAEESGVPGGQGSLEATAERGRLGRTRRLWACVELKAWDNYSPLLVRVPCSSPRGVVCRGSWATICQSPARR
jgi:hypothetical protein